MQSQSGKEVSVAQMPKRKRKLVLVHNYFCRFQTEYYIAACIGNKEDAHKWLKEYADSVTKMDSQKLPRGKVIRMSRKGNRIIGRETFIINLQYVCTFGTKREGVFYKTL